MSSSPQYSVSEESQYTLSKILRDIFFFFSSKVYISSSWRIYYRERNDVPKFLDPFPDEPAYYEEYAERLLKILTDLAFRKDLLYAVAIGSVSRIEPSKDCIKYDNFSGISQFFDETAFMSFFQNLRNSFHHRENPLEQILSYYNSTEHEKKVSNVYICGKVYIVEPYSSRYDPSSIFSGHEGLVAYCTTLSNIERVVYLDYDTVLYQLSSIYKTIMEKWRELAKNGKQYCNVEDFEVQFHEEIEKANNILRRYGIIRATVVLN